MRKAWFAAVAASALLAGCTTPQRGAIPVQDSGAPVSNQDRVGSGGRAQQAPAAGTAQNIPQGDSGVVVMVPQDAGAAPIQTFPAQTGSAPLGTSAPITPGPQYSTPGSMPSPTAGGTYQPPVAAPSQPTGIPSGNSAASGNGNLAADEQLDGPVLALLTTAQQQQGGGDLNGAAASLERAQRIAPREPQVLYKLAQVRLAQGDAPQAEQLARRGLSYASGRPTLQASLWELIAQSRERQGDPTGAAQARQNAKVTL
ncbi:hypothetical protein FQZ97_896840 [compost metagenome]